MPPTNTIGSYSQPVEELRRLMEEPNPFLVQVIGHIYKQPPNAHDIRPLIDHCIEQEKTQENLTAGAGAVQGVQSGIVDLSILQEVVVKNINMDGWEVERDVFVLPEQ